MFIHQFQVTSKPFVHGNLGMICPSRMNGVNLISIHLKTYRYEANVRLNQLTRRLSHHIKVAETSYYFILTMLELKVALEITLITCIG